MGETSYGKSRYLSVKWEFSKKAELSIASEPMAYSLITAFLYSFFIIK